MNKQRTERVAEEIRREVNRIVREDLSDPRIKGTFSITRVDLTNDLSFAKVYVSILEEENAPELMKALESASGFVRRELGKNIIIRHTPQITFVKDENIAYGMHIADVIDRVIGEDKTHGNSENEQEQ
ncbi:MAG: 30S ribosome-binding factor RbfA [Clostridiales bacterium]|nr:30S ribosome-binding factor RbfA [Clostridiales bacterium]